jgi:hypothetical protein
MDRFVALQQLAQRIAPWAFQSSIDTSVRPPLVNPPEERTPWIEGYDNQPYAPTPSVTPDNPYSLPPLTNPPATDEMKRGSLTNPIIENLQKIFKSDNSNEKFIDIPIDQIEHGESAMPGGKLTFPGARDLIKKYAERKTPLPPIKVVPPDEDNSKWMVEDGSHRLEAAILRGEKTIRAENPFFSKKNKNKNKD